MVRRRNRMCTDFRFQGLKKKRSAEDGVAGGHQELCVEIVRANMFFKTMPKFQDLSELFLGRPCAVGEVGDGDFLASAVVPEFRTEFLRRRFPAVQCEHIGQRAAILRKRDLRKHYVKLKHRALPSSCPFRGCSRKLFIQPNLSGIHS